MKFCVFGAGAVGGFVGGQVAHAAGSTGAEVSLVARGPQLAAVRQNGLNIEAPDDTYTVRPAATDNPVDASPGRSSAPSNNEIAKSTLGAFNRAAYLYPPQIDANARCINVSPAVAYGAFGIFSCVDIEHLGGPRG